MTKQMFRLRKVAAIAACLAVTMGFASCETDDDDGTKVPGAVTNFTTTAGNAQVSLVWDTPSDDGGTDITGYEVTRDDWASKETKSASQLSHTYTGLTNETEYTFKVRAVNAKGAGEESSATATPKAPNNEPLGDWSLPTNLKVVFNENGVVMTSIKIENEYWIDNGTMEAFLTSSMAYYVKSTGGAWSFVHNVKELYDVIGTFYSDMYHTRSTVALRPVTGTDVVLGRPVEIRTTAATPVVDHYIDIEHKLVLKRVRPSDNTVRLEVTLWDETVTDFGGIDLPE